MLLATTAMIVTGVVCFERGFEGIGLEAVRPILAGLAFFGWALLASHVSRVFVVVAAFGFSGVAFAMTGLGLRLRDGRAATDVAVACSVVLTAVSFTLLHGSQWAARGRRYWFCLSSARC